MGTVLAAIFVLFFSEFVFCTHVTTDKEADMLQAYYG